MTDDPNPADDLPEEPTGTLAEGAEAASPDDAPLDEVFDGETEGHPEYDTQAIMQQAMLDRMHRKAYWHSNQRQLFAFLFANCMFFASGFVAWVRAGYAEVKVDGEWVVQALDVDASLLFSGVDTIRGGLIFALAIYGFWTAVFNIWHAQMKVWPYLLGATLALWVGLGGFISTIGGEQWELAIRYKDSAAFGSKSLFTDMTVPLSTIAPAFWLLAIGGLMVVWIIINGLMQGSQAAKSAATQEAQSTGRRRRR